MAITAAGSADKLQTPQRAEATADTPEARLFALELQTRSDHKVMEAMANAINALQMKVMQHEEGVEASTAMGVSLRRETFAAKSEIANAIAGANDVAQHASRWQ